MPTTNGIGVSEWHFSVSLGSVEIFVHVTSPNHFCLIELDELYLLVTLVWSS